MSLRSDMQKSKEYDLMKRRIIGARKMAGTGARGYKLNIAYQVLGKLVVLSDMTKN